MFLLSPVPGCFLSWKILGAGALLEFRQVLIFSPLLLLFCALGRDSHQKPTFFLFSPKSLRVYPLSRPPTSRQMPARVPRFGFVTGRPPLPSQTFSCRHLGRFRLISNSFPLNCSDSHMIPKTSLFEKAYACPFLCPTCSDRRFLVVYRSPKSRTRCLTLH